MDKVLWISIGAVLGANLRYWVGDWAAQRFGSSFPYGTLLINLSGSFLLGLIVSMSMENFIIDPRLRLLLTIGFLGSYTTFSTYAYESVALISQGQWGLGLFNLLGSSLLGVLFAVLGIWLGKIL
ncbi:MAG: fluoride efflux transporter CrcB [Chloroflexi bacterium HGW-Chloroflexi-2]|jgi:CrcB protein|nr:MAG: fluoride efflux transporter CrcB [Chloroflexi bacterium HGW-Chloroflexi-2]